jgi:hypothetical protein
VYFGSLEAAGHGFMSEKKRLLIDKSSDAIYRALEFREAQAIGLITDQNLSPLRIWEGHERY